ncbi:NAD(P)H-hydrate epimerase [Fontimonas thermophila]|uniref:Bifunctional NAD(P)H-hydrate repair enzyme n=1 Tax=Fontimonas thermophila TaxID=1076937 RepID=A0A1I2HP77_9GAMM|nr:NAD(P)H-hydrate dehydratase [Fontimonas thermophila]SFF30637.1 NAD(P)H-hydrate epimerase [Fontimonas thermophila]
MQDIRTRLYVAEQVRALDHRVIASGIDGYALMQRAAAACWRALVAHHGVPRRIVIVCGPGNNGGDGYEIAQLAQRAQATVWVYAVGGVPQRGEAARAYAAWSAAGHVVAPCPAVLPECDWVIDALLGTGLSRAPEGAIAAAIAAINAARMRGARVLAVDVPSGLDASRGHAPGACVQADVTVSFIGNKFGLWTGQGPDCAGQRLFDDLGIDPRFSSELVPVAELQDEAELVRLGRRARGAHKGDFGHVLIIGGNRGMAGAALLAGRAALRSGAGLVSLATRPEHAAALTAAQPELMVHGVDTGNALDALLSRADVVVLGPGLGQDEWARALFARVLASDAALLLDADALNLLARTPRHREHWILTPHPGEAARLLQCSSAQIQADRLGALAELQHRYGGTIVLKGAGSLVSGPPVSVCPYGNPGMAVGGMGDALTGIVAALWAQGLEAPVAARLGVLAHACAGDHAAVAGERGLLPQDLIGCLRTVLNPS